MQAFVYGYLLYRIHRTVPIVQHTNFLVIFTYIRQVKGTVTVQHVHARLILQNEHKDVSTRGSLSLTLHPIPARVHISVLVCRQLHLCVVRACESVCVHMYVHLRTYMSAHVCMCMSFRTDNVKNSSKSTIP